MLRLELVLLDKSEISCIFCSMVDGNPVRNEHINERNKKNLKNRLIKMQNGQIEANTQFKLLSVFSSCFSQLNYDDRNRWCRLLIKRISDIIP